jgi:hypothetical protein
MVGACSPSPTARACVASGLRSGVAAEEHEGGLVGFREMREHRRLFDRLLGDFERSLVPKKEPRRYRRRLSEIAADIEELP